MVALRWQPGAEAMAVMTPAAIFDRCLKDMGDRATQRDTPEGERSMAKTVRAFWEIHGQNILSRGYMTEAEGWLFMEVLKMVRGAQGVFHADDHIDRVAYAALAAEAAFSTGGEA